MHLFEYKGITIIFIIFNILIICNTSRNLKYKARNNYKFMSGFAFEEINVTSLSHCLAYCASNITCNSVSFKQPSGPCILSAFDTIDDSCLSWSVEFVDGWTSVGLMRFPGKVKTFNWKC